MSYRDFDEDADDCYEDPDDEVDEEQPARCPECGGLVHSIADQCPACGRWLSVSDRNAMWAETSQPSWIRWTAVVVLVALLVPLLLAAVTWF